MTQYNPLHSLTNGSWFKLICGASYQHLPAVRNLALAYSLAGADCIDVAADTAVIAAAREGINVARELWRLPELFTAKKNSENRTLSSNPRLQTSTSDLIKDNVDGAIELPWLTISINDGEDPHFRKAQFDSTQCPIDCPAPCIQACPADAIDLDSVGIIDDLCYGCGRCVPICPQGLINTRSYVSEPKEIAFSIDSMAIDALEIHTQVGHYDDFKRVWQAIAPVAEKLKLLSISCTEGQNVIDYLRSLYELISPLPCPLIWQTDGRSMSGDIGKGTTHAAIAFAQKVLQADLPGYIQPAGGTNDYTVDKLDRLKMLRKYNPTSAKRYVSGVAYGSYARAILTPILDELETTELQNIQSNLIKDRPMKQLNLKLEQNPDLLARAVSTASQLVNQIKTSC